MRIKRDDSELVVMGVDPGLATGGIVIANRRSDGRANFIDAFVIGTEKCSKKQRKNTRITDDDVRRHKEIFEVFEIAYGKYKPYAVGIETYMPFNARGGGNSLKTLGVYGGVLWWCFSRGLVVFPFLPIELKMRCVGCRSASKINVESRVRLELVGLDRAMRDIDKGNREHIADAAGYALLAIDEVNSVRKIMGL